MAAPTTDRYTTFVEDMGLVSERRGLPRIAGRVFALLLVTPDALSLEEIAQRLSVSRASVSTDARLLQRLGVIERTSRPGDRRDYYRIAPDHHIRSVEQALEAFAEMNRVLERALVDPPLDPVIEERLREWLHVQMDVSATLRDRLEEWRARAAAGPLRRGVA